MAERPSCVYAIFLESTPEQVWHALTDPDRSAAWWAHRNVSTWTEGAEWRHERDDGTHVPDVVGTVLASAPPTRLVLTWANPVDRTAVAGVGEPAGEERGPEPSRATFDIEGGGRIVRLTVTHDNLASEAEATALAAGWAAVLSNLKTFLETGHPLPRPPWEMLPGFVRS